MDNRQIIQEKIQSVKKELSQSENRLKVLENRKWDTERRERTHRLIERGAILESFASGLDKLTNEQVKELLAVALKNEEARQYLRGLGLL